MCQASQPHRFRQFLPFSNSSLMLVPSWGRWITPLGGSDKRKRPVATSILLLWVWCALLLKIAALKLVTAAASLGPTQSRCKERSSGSVLHTDSITLVALHGRRTSRELPSGHGSVTRLPEALEKNPKHSAISLSAANCLPLLHHCTVKTNSCDPPLRPCA